MGKRLPIFKDRNTIFIGWDLFMTLNVEYVMTLKPRPGMKMLTTWTNIMTVRSSSNAVFVRLTSSTVFTRIDTSPIVLVAKAVKGTKPSKPTRIG